ncbi:putative transcription factor WD40-like family [Rosa chinensis]|uniref:Serine-threonine kinase receptor-associated protein n=2 Tax=Rosa chinensis TaxID=74649 RepID=A0A2P6PC66_ROSCH|nr:putative transcription factor WD40-like family [Rosa chinensis]
MAHAHTVVCPGHERSIMDLCYSPDPCGGSLLLSASMDRRAILRDGECGDWIRTFAEQTSSVWNCSLNITATASTAATASHCNAKIWDLQTGRLLHIIQSRNLVQSCAFSKNGHSLLTGGLGYTIRIFDLEHPHGKPEILRESNKPQRGSVLTAAWLHNDQVILSTCSLLQGVRLWDRRSGKILRTLETESIVRSSELSQGYITTAAGSTVTFWDETDFRCVNRYKMPCMVQSASLYGNKFIAGGDDGLVRLFDFHTGEEIEQSNMGDFGTVLCVRFSPDGKSYAAGFEDGTVIIKKL